MKKKISISGLFLFCCVILISCNRGDVDDGCETKQFSGTFTVDRIEYKDDKYHQRRIIHGTFNADDADAPQELKTRVLKKQVEAEELFNIGSGKKYKTNVSYVISGPCPPDPSLDYTKNWKAVP